MISYETSQNMISLLSITNLRSERVFLSSGLGRILAEDIVADSDYPIHPTSAMDGYAIAHRDLENYETFEVLGDNPAGADDIGGVISGACIKTFTGSLMPSGSDTLLVDTLGGESVQMGIVGDDQDAIMERFEEAISSCDIVVSTGGVSVGDYDFVKDIVPRLGAKVIFKGVNIKPGQHVMVAQRGDKFVVSLPGFAYSSTVTFILYAGPLIARMMGIENPYEVIEATLKVPFVKRSNKSEFTACNLSFEEGRYWVDFEGKKGGSSAILTNLLGNAGLMICGEEDGDLEAGTLVRVIKL
ncbi:MAG: molybdopterin molybdotransferase MoeA [Epsilonproteobacteria bacterium]|nr:molybdopterin molybdotransferase MoeA [Campylobacterota bacterium]